MIRRNEVYYFLISAIFQISLISTLHGVEGYLVSLLLGSVISFSYLNDFLNSQQVCHVL